MTAPGGPAGPIFPIGPGGPLFPMTPEKQVKRKIENTTIENYEQEGCMDDNH